MAGLFTRRSLWLFSHSASIFSAVLLFTAQFLCVLLWINDFVHTEASTSPSTVTFTYLSAVVWTFNITYNVAIFGTAWNSILFVVLLILERDALPIPTERLRYEAEKAACIVAVAGNAMYSVACFALLATLARLAAHPSSTLPMSGNPAAGAVVASAGAKRARQGATAAMAGIIGAAAVTACFMDWMHQQHSHHRRNVMEYPIVPRDMDKEE